MSATNPGARFKYNLAGRTSGIIRSFIIGDTKTVTVGDFVHLETGYIDTAAANEPLLGVVVGIVDQDGINLDNSKRTLTGSGASWTTSTQTVVTGSDNTSTDYLRVLVDIDPFSVWSVEPDSAIGQDAQSDLAGCFTDLITEAEVDEDGAVAGQAALFIWGVDPEDTSRGLYSIAEHQIWQYT